ncbi:MAG: FMN-binding protein [Proteobacteria bacterium]|nr:FMN-binding protein [Pseudomonadota bacterium]
MSDKLKSFGFAFILCLMCSLLLTLASSGLKAYQQRNILLDQHKNLLKSVGLIDEAQRYTPVEIKTLYDKNIKKVRVDAEGTIIDDARPSDKNLKLYLYMKAGVVESYIVPIDTQGLWGKIHGYMAIEKDGSTINGFTVYQHNETPGLGGEIEKQWFQKNFVGKKIVDQKGDFVSISISRGQVKDTVKPERRINYVDGISGATLTGKYLTTGLRQVLSGYEPVSIHFRKHR